jgi:hypothetical protein
VQLRLEQPAPGVTLRLLASITSTTATSTSTSTNTTTITTATTNTTRRPRANRRRRRRRLLARGRLGHSPQQPRPHGPVKPTRRRIGQWLSVRSLPGGRAQQLGMQAIDQRSRQGGGTQGVEAEARERAVGRHCAHAHAV